MDPFDPGTNLLAVRADESDLAVAAVRITLTCSGGTSVSFRDDGFGSRLRDAAVGAYEQLSLSVLSVGGRTERINFTGEERGELEPADVRGNSVFAHLLPRGDTKRNNAQVRLGLRTSGTVPSKPTVRTDFDESAVEFHQWVPERILIEHDRVVSAVQQGK
ncbi:hypothetical protein B4589_004545 [Halolamina sp. CBA1230]|uniref:hypothetical protein n=1 Tax=Halolamina sp. CBA1230 TaxID=1853690 RepID=UPI0009A1B0DD|nr:hypothetical protein [Halolamina sp. CBA1230]QKY19682.1 hypothetical protein B4589_004545 [Halolamina sp. CBA1230]